MPSFSRPSVSDDNPFSESLFKTLKYHPTFPRMTCFESITEARFWCEKFEEWYNHKHLHSALKFVTPNQRHTGEDKAVLAKRHAVYQMAKTQRPDRWSGNTRNWTPDNMVSLNPDKKRILNTGDNLLDSFRECDHYLAQNCEILARTFFKSVFLGSACAKANAPII